VTAERTTWLLEDIQAEDQKGLAAVLGSEMEAAKGKATGSQPRNRNRDEQGAGGMVACRNFTNQVNADADQLPRSTKGESNGQNKRNIRDTGKKVSKLNTG